MLKASSLRFLVVIGPRKGEKRKMLSLLPPSFLPRLLVGETRPRSALSVLPKQKGHCRVLCSVRIQSARP